MRDLFFSTTAQLVSLSILFCLTGWLYLFPISDERQIALDQKSRINDEARIILGMEREVARLEAMTAHIIANKEEISRFRNRFLKQKDERIVAISAFLHESAGKNNLKPQRITYQSNLSKQKEVEVYQIRFPIQGHFRDIRKFIADIESSDMFLIIQEMTVEDSTSTGAAVSVDLTLATYFEGDPS